MARRARPLPTARQLCKQSLLRWRSQYLMVLLVAVVWVGVNVLLRFLYDDASLAGQLWAVLIVAIILWLFGRRAKKRPGVGELFYDGSANFLKLVLVFGVWVLYLIPLALGAFLALQFNSYQFSPSASERMAVGVAWTLLAAVSFYWIIRSYLAPLYAQKLSPIKALRASWAFTKARAWWVSRAVIVTLLVAMVPIVLFSLLLLTPLGAEPWFYFVVTTLISFAAVSFAVPLLVALGYEMEKYERTSTKTTKAKK